MKKKLKVTIIQSDVIWLEREKNLDLYSKFLDKISDSDIIFFPEFFDTGFYVEPSKLDANEDNKTINWLKQNANKRNFSIGASTAIREDGKFYNRFIIAHPDDKVDYYNKRHLFKHAGELNEYSPGLVQKTFNIDNWKIKPLVCYDLRFPVWARNTENYHILTYIANWPTSRIEQWKALLIARAIENQCYTIGVNRVGEDGNGFDYPGKSLIISPKGDIIYEAKNLDVDIFTAELDFDYLQNIRTKFPVLEDIDDFKIL